MEDWQGHIREQQGGQEIFLQLSLEKIQSVIPGFSSWKNCHQHFKMDPSHSYYLQLVSFLRKCRNWARVLLRILWLQGRETRSIYLRKNRILRGKHSRLPLKQANPQAPVMPLSLSWNAGLCGFLLSATWCSYKSDLIIIPNPFSEVHTL